MFDTFGTQYGDGSRNLHGVKLRQPRALRSSRVGNARRAYRAFYQGLAALPLLFIPLLGGFIGSFATSFRNTIPSSLAPATSSAGFHLQSRQNRNELVRHDISCPSYLTGPERLPA